MQRRMRLKYINISGKYEFINGPRVLFEITTPTSEIKKTDMHFDAQNRQHS